MRMFVRTTKAQREAVALVRSELAQRRYYIFPVAKWYRKHQLDFLAVPRGEPQMLVLVRPLRNGSISVRPFAIPSWHESVRALLRHLQPKLKTPVRWNSRQLLHAKAQPDRWDQYLSAQSRREYARIS